ncbi:hypothetical protein ETD86_45810 [Nonomuraea turkmeniaca]|uniref:Uncharacterized protein n=1 Tax=Nonomuraea turkmeniaca TaxID=103838 RepID=A0A5S4EYU5_9ACTN|nr:hypothetical protein [Nonomuraea turkmeniaca]TMR08892.1 hypothetical protein ETD86_45810 [Nonomuraea turkmeniaca]
MPIEVVHELRCSTDGCGSYYRVATGDPDDVIDGARDRGWTVGRTGVDYCPGCSRDHAGEVEAAPPSAAPSPDWSR